jgi:hypothetical protein
MFMKLTSGRWIPLGHNQSSVAGLVTFQHFKSGSMDGVGIRKFFAEKLSFSF